MICAVCITSSWMCVVIIFFIIIIYYYCHLQTAVVVRQLTDNRSVIHLLYLYNISISHNIIIIARLRGAGIIKNKYVPIMTRCRTNVDVYRPPTARPHKTALPIYTNCSRIGLTVLVPLDDMCHRINSRRLQSRDAWSENRYLIY